MKRTRPEREALAAKRLQSVLGRHGIATMRTLEQKISDAGPTNQRINPHVLTQVRNDLVKLDVLVREKIEDFVWFRLKDADPAFVQTRLDAMVPIAKAVHDKDLTMRIGQALEIATYRALCAARDTYDFIGSFLDLDDHDDSKRFSKEEPAAISGKSTPGDTRLDFISIHAVGKYAAIEVKNTREWIYPRSEEVRALLAKACAIDAVPVLIGRRVHYSTHSVLSKCGLLFHENYNQLYPASAANIATHARDKNLLGYHDIRTGNVPDKRLARFFSEILPSQIDSAHERFAQYRDLLEKYANGEMDYKEFAGRAKRRSEGRYEDADVDPNDIEPDEIFDSDD